MADENEEGEDFEPDPDADEEQYPARGADTPEEDEGESVVPTDEEEKDG